MTMNISYKERLCDPTLSMRILDWPWKQVSSLVIFTSLLSSPLNPMPRSHLLLCSRCPGVASPSSLPCLTDHTDLLLPPSSTLTLLTPSPTPASIPWEPASQVCQRSKEASKTGLLASIFHSLSSPPIPIPESHPQLCNLIILYPQSHGTK